MYSINTPLPGVFFVVLPLFTDVLQQEATVHLQTDQLQLAGIVTAKTSCGCCDKVINLTDAVVSTHHITPHTTYQEHFCSNRCAEIEWRMRG